MAKSHMFSHIFYQTGDILSISEIAHAPGEPGLYAGSLDSAEPRFLFSADPGAAFKPD